MVTAATRARRALLSARRPEIDAVLIAYGASSPEIFGSVARGDATATSDIDLLVDLDDCGNPLMRVAGLSEELSDVLGVRVDVVSEGLLRKALAVEVARDRIPL